MTALAEIPVSRALAISTTRLNEAVRDCVVSLATRNGSATSTAVRYIHYANVTAQAVGLAKSNAAVIGCLPIVTRARLALMRNGLARELPKMTRLAETLGGPKSHNQIFKFAKKWLFIEGLELDAVGIEEVVSRIESIAGPGRTHE